MKTIILLILLMATLCFSQTPVTEIYIYSGESYITVESFTWGEERSQTNEYYIYHFEERSQDYYGIFGNYILWNEILKDDDCEEDELFYWEDDDNK